MADRTRQRGDVAGGFYLLWVSARGDLGRPLRRALPDRDQRRLGGDTGETISAGLGGDDAGDHRPVSVAVDQAVGCRVDVVASGVEVRQPRLRCHPGVDYGDRYSPAA